MRRLLRILLVLAAPVVAALYLLHESRPDYRPLDLPRPGDPLDVQGAAPLREVALRFLLADGRPAAETVVLVTQPRMGYAETGADGVARVALPDGPLAFTAFHGGMQVLRWGPQPEPPGQALQFTAREDTRPRLEEPGGPHTAVLLARGPAEQPLPGVLLLVRRADRLDEAPWVGLADADGRIELRGLPDGPLLGRVYAPGTVPSPASLLGEREFNPAGRETPRALVCDCAWLRVEGLPPDALAELHRVDVPGVFSDRLVPGDGVLSLGPLPAGGYRLKVGAEERELELRPERPGNR